MCVQAHTIEANLLLHNPTCTYVVFADVTLPLTVAIDDNYDDEKASITILGQPKALKSLFKGPFTKQPVPDILKPGADGGAGTEPFVAGLAGGGGGGSSGGAAAAVPPFPAVSAVPPLTSKVGSLLARVLAPESEAPDAVPSVALSE